MESPDFKPLLPLLYLKDYNNSLIADCIYLDSQVRKCFLGLVEGDLEAVKTTLRGIASYTKKLEKEIGMRDGEFGRKARYDAEEQLAKAGLPWVVRSDWDTGWTLYRRFLGEATTVIRSRVKEIEKARKMAMPKN
jgi:hypothetical protein